VKALMMRSTEGTREPVDVETSANVIPLHVLRGVTDHAMQLRALHAGSRRGRYGRGAIDL
jgi:hypothetical protein